MGLITVRYEIAHPGIPAEFDGYRLAVLADLHNCTLGEGNTDLLNAIRFAKPDGILIAGDMVVEKTRKRKARIGYKNAENLITTLASRFPVYYENGNHESRWKRNKDRHSEKFEDYRRRLAAAGVHFLENGSLRIGKLRITGLELPNDYFHKKIRIPRLTAEKIAALAGTADPDCFNILLAHSPQFFKAYMEWGADLVIAGHFHGGMVRLPLFGGVVSTYMRPFPRYDHGVFRSGEQRMIVSAGLGMHSIPIRINNPEELVILELRRRN